MFSYNKDADYCDRSKKTTVPFNPFPNDKFFNSSKLKEFAEDNFRFDENGRKFSEG